MFEFAQLNAGRPLLYPLQSLLSFIDIMLKRSQLEKILNFLAILPRRWLYTITEIMFRRFLAYFNFCDQPMPCAKEIKKPGRNAYMQFLEVYRQRCGEGKSNRDVIREAAAAWRDMSPLDRLPYKKAAREAPYVFVSRNRRANRVLNHLRRSILSETEVDVYFLREAMKEMAKWKAATAKRVCRR